MDNDFVLAARRCALLSQGAPHDKKRLLVLQPHEHADNQEVQLKVTGVWECGGYHCRDCEIEQQDGCFAHYSLYSLTGSVLISDSSSRERRARATIPRRGDEIRGMQEVRIETPLADGETRPTLYLAEEGEPVIKRGRPRLLGTKEDRRKATEAKFQTMASEGWTMEAIETLKRSELLQLAASLDLRNPAFRGDNNALRKAIAVELGLR